MFYCFYSLLKMYSDLYLLISMLFGLLWRVISLAIIPHLIILFYNYFPLGCVKIWYMYSTMYKIIGTKHCSELLASYYTENMLLYPSLLRNIIKKNKLKLILVNTCKWQLYIKRTPSEISRNTCIGNSCKDVNL